MASSIAFAQAQYGSASFLPGQFAEPWPLYTKNGRQRRAVRYCFADRLTRKLVQCALQDAMTLWSNGLGTPSNPEAGHSLAWEEAGTISEPQYCFWNGIWNPLVWKDALVIESDLATSASSASVGYNNFREDHHSMKIGNDRRPAILAHELGHVLGMVHEQCRNDRDDYVLYRCDKVRGYNDALKRAMADGHSKEAAQAKLCENQAFALTYKFDGSEFVKNDAFGANPGMVGALDEPGGFDVNSIMLYRSEAFSDVIACGLRSTECPLVEVQRGVNNNIIGTTLIPERTAPSARDFEWVKRWYPAVDSPAQK